MSHVVSTFLETKPGLTRAGASLVPDAERMEFLPQFFGLRHMLKGEFLVYDWMGSLCQDYSGGLWNFYIVKSGGFYMAPSGDKRWWVRCSGNGFEGEMTSDAAGIVATLFTLSHLSLETELDRFSNLFHSLRSCAMRHVEASAILAAID